MGSECSEYYIWLLPGLSITRYSGLVRAVKRPSIEGARRAVSLSEVIPPADGRIILRSSPRTTSR